MRRFNLTDRQAAAILNLRLRHLAKLEEMKIRAEQTELEQERDSLEQTLGSTRRLKTLIRKEIEADAENTAMSVAHRWWSGVWPLRWTRPSSCRGSQ